MGDGGDVFYDNEADIVNVGMLSVTAMERNNDCLSSLWQDEKGKRIMRSVQRITSKPTEEFNHFCQLKLIPKNEKS